MAHYTQLPAVVGDPGQILVSVDLALGTYPAAANNLPASCLYVSPNVTTAPTPVTDSNPLPVKGAVLDTIAASVGGLLTDAELRATAVPVSLASVPSHAVTNAGTFAVQVTSAPTTAVTGPLTDAELRATPVPVSGTVTATTGGLTDAELRATAVPVSVAGTVTVDLGVNNDVTVTGDALTALQKIDDPVATIGGVDVNRTAIFDSSGNQITQFVGVQDAYLVQETTPITSGNTFSTAVIALNVNYNQIMFSAETDKDGEMRIYWYADAGGTQELRAKTYPYTGGQRLDVHANLTYAPYVKVQFQNTSGTNQTRFWLAGRVSTLSYQASVGSLYDPIETDALYLHTKTLIYGVTTGGGGGYVPVKVTPSGGLLGAVTQDGTWNLTNISGTISLPTGASTAANQTTLIGYVDGIEALLTTIDADTSVLAGVDFATGADVASLGVVGGGTEATALRVTIASDSTGVLSIDDGGGSITVDGTITANLGTIADVATQTTLSALNSKVTACNTGAVVLTTSTASIGKLASNSGVTIGAVEIAAAQTLATVTTVGAVTSITNALPAGTNAIGKLAANSGVDIGDVDVTSIAAGANLIGDVGLQPRTSGGLTMHKTTSAASTNATSVKASAGQVYAMQCFNVNAAVRYIKLYNKASAPTVGTDTPVKTLAIPGNTAAAGFGFSWPQGLEFTTGIAFALTTEATDAGTTGVAANELTVNIDYK